MSPRHTRTEKEAQVASGFADPERETFIYPLEQSIPFLDDASTVCGSAVSISTEAAHK